MTVSVSCDAVSINLYNIANFIPIDDTIIGLKYLVKKDKIIIRGAYNKETVPFYNQISIIIRIENKTVNVKIFKNGSLHITGCKKVSDAQNVIDTLTRYYSMMRLETINISLSQTEDGTLLTKDCMVYSEKYKQVIGYLNEEKEDWTLALVQNLIGGKESKACSYVINKEKVIVNKDGNFISEGNIKKHKTIYNKDGEVIGETCIQMFNNSLKLFKHKNLNIDYHSDSITVGKDNEIGKIVYVYNKETRCAPNILKNSDNYSCSAILRDCDSYTGTVINVNCINIVIDLGVKINREKLYSNLVDKNYMVLYNPNKYSGIRLLFKTIVGKLSFMIFQSGKVLGSGFKSTSQIDQEVPKFKKLINDIVNIP